MFIRFFSGLLALLLAGHAWAQTCTVYIATAGGFTGSPAASAQAAVDSAVAKFKAAVSKSSTGSGPSLVCASRGFYSSGTEHGSEYGWVMVESQVRLTNYDTGQPYCSSEWSGGGRSGVGVQKKDGAECPDNCADSAGKVSTLNFTVGWARSGTADARDWVGPLSMPSYSAPVCSDGCTQELTGDDAGNSCYRSQVPAATGLNRISCDYNVRASGKSCTPGPADAAHDPKAPPEPCPGFTGEVNGETKCVGTASKPIAAPAGQGVAGSTGKGEQSGNPTAGTKPGSGEGSGKDGPGRTPTAGTGTASGGPAGAAGNGTKPDGTTPKPGEGKEQAACGAPGQPKCGIDETGTPTKYDGNGAALDGWKEGVDKDRATIEKSGSGVFDSFNVFFSAPPIVGCEPIELPNKEVITRHCDVVGGTRAVMAYIWALSALWLCVGWIREAI